MERIVISKDKGGEGVQPRLSAEWLWDLHALLCSMYHF